MKAELVIMREETICLETRLISAENELAEMKRVVSEYKATEKIADYLLEVVLGAEGGGDNVNINSKNLDVEETMIEELTMRDVLTTEVLQNVAQQPRGGSHPSDGGNDASTTDDTTTVLNLDQGKNIETVKEACGGGNAGGTGKAE